MGVKGEWFVRIADTQRGPLTLSEVADLVRSGDVTPETLTWKPGQATWIAAAQVPGIFQPPVLDQPPPAQSLDIAIADQSQKMVFLEGEETAVSSRPDAFNRESATEKHTTQQGWLARSFIARHWRGELSLPVSYWLVNVVATVTILIVAGVIGATFSVNNDGLNFSPTWAFLTLVTVWASVLAIYFWQVTGVWRSADNHTSRGGLAFWAFAAKAMVIIGGINMAMELSKSAIPQLTAYIEILKGDPALAKREIRVLRGGTEIAYSGGITFGAAAHLQTVLDAAPGARVIHLNSHGGRTLEARNLGDIIRQRGLSTYTSEVCASACTIAFMAGRQRWVGRTAKLGFHSYNFDQIMAESEAAVATAEAKVELKDLGISESFVNRVFETSHAEMWYPSINELRAARVVTGVAETNSFAMSGLDLEVTPEKIDQSLRAIPIFRTLSIVEPLLYSKILDDFAIGAANGDTQAEITARIRPQIIPLYLKYMPRAEDAVLLEAINVMVDELQVLMGAKDGACYSFLFPSKRQHDRDIMSYFSQDLKRRDLEVFNKVLESADRPNNFRIQQAASEKIMEELMPRLAEKYGVDVLDALSRIEENGVDPHLVCVASHALYSEILKLPGRQPVTVLRYMFNQPS